MARFDESGVGEGALWDDAYEDDDGDGQLGGGESLWEAEVEAIWEAGVWKGAVQGEGGEGW